MRTFRLPVCAKFNRHPCRLHCFSDERAPRTKTVQVPVGGSGYVQVKIRYPSPKISSTSSIVVYLPPGPSISTEPNDDTSSTNTHPCTILSSLLPNTTIITLKYRLSPPTQTFPQPIHDTSIAFNYIIHILANHAPSKISLLGSRIGGALATSLALTSPNVIHSVAVTEPILDWPSLDISTTDDPDPNSSKTLTTAKKAKPDPHTPAATTNSLLTLRSHLFPTPDHYFDPFASPTLFLRAPGRDCPQPPAPDADRSSSFNVSVNSVFRLDDDSDHGQQGSDGDAAGITQRPIKRRKVLRRWPVDASPDSVKLPRFRVFVSDDPGGEGMVLRRQGQELVELMRKVCFYGWEREVVEEWVGVQVLARAGSGKVGIWGIEEAVRWLARVDEEDGTK